MTRRLRVVQWATGSMGKTCLRAVLDAPDLELVGLYVYSAAKAGVDAGEIARRPATGVLATSSIDDILALDADVVLHCPMLASPYDGHDPDVKRLLESGKNVISINNYFHPWALGGAYARDLEASALQGGATLAGVGVNPGWAAEKVAAAVAGISLRLDHISTSEVIDCSGIPNAAYVFGALGMGADPAGLDLKDGPLARTFTDMYAQSVAALAQKLGIELDAVEADHSVTLADNDFDVRAGVVRIGTVAATTWRVHGLSGGVRRITHAVNWVMDMSLPAFAGKPHWEIEVTGLPGVRLSMDLAETPEPGVRTKPEQYAVAGMVLSAIPRVAAAPPGLWRGEP
ncbi:hypothetical protein ASE17_04225 [Phenylobacterium sp. Root77]|uniref:NAD(P)H-dependent amine dehydrogenase family protein n=1 Tax=unclassified Phenylobacterium TaxID=2640670 RepID=UPI0006FC0724|nr:MULTISPECIES: hypothetical protein [unclassified Phenylobacterium]KQW72081.1 hypothetical protein ASC73_08450 [Phenylobacterium sp. Root1277]KQW95001.1 hypothetical protein ASC79_04595 [Phenylobacterium sp. Root1290]KRC44694.1 hypothetical protein ASE17_04225 [Phenylobacterium sp. Root77]